MRPRLSFLGLLFLVAGGFFTACSRAETQPAPTPIIEIVQVFITATPRPTATPTNTSTPTQTSTPTPTPTPTAIPALITGDPLASLAAEPVPQVGAVCGFVDYFDFPIDPPEAEMARGGGDYGVHRERYQGNHAGEDWGLPSRDNLGEPVYVIGHGVVTYSQPYGWGLDQGTVIVRHTFRDGRTVYSFYGHLDPPSVVLRPGDCLKRGDTVGNIGDPTGRPHLHFEIRLHNPDTPGPGYWSVNPTLAGWLPPSQTIWENRITGQTGTIWSRVPAEGSRWLGTAGETLLVVEEEELRALSRSDGHIIWRHEFETSSPILLLSTQKGLVYQADSSGHLNAYTLPTPEEAAGWNNLKIELSLAWELEREVSDSPVMLPLPGGGMVMADRDTTTALSPEGEVLWSTGSLFTLADWVLAGDQVIVSSVGESPTLWRITDSGSETLAEGIGGSLALAGARLFVYAPAGLYWVALESGVVEKIHTLSNAVQFNQTILPLPDGGVLVAHADPFDRRILAFEADGSLRWERSIKTLGTSAQFLSEEGEIYVLVEALQSSAAVAHLYRIDLFDGTLTDMFKGGTRTSVRNAGWVAGLESGEILLQIGGGHMVLFDPAGE